MMYGHHVYGDKQKCSGPRVRTGITYTDAKQECTGPRYV